MTIKQLSDGGPTGTLLGQSSTDKIGFYGLAVPIARPVNIVAATDAATAVTQGNLLLAAIKSLGLIASA